jgi:threonine aldolase
MFFGSDNGAGASKPVMDAILAANNDFRLGYGGDLETREIEQKFNDLFETNCSVYLVATGTAANALALSALTPSYGVVLAHEFSHIVEDECGAPEFYMGGARLTKIAGEAGKISLKGLENSLKLYSKRIPHAMPLKAMSLSQVTEAGTVYTCDELTALNGLAKQHGLNTHLDGARFGNAIASLNCSPADMSWRAGVDVLSFGATKGGALALEAIVFFNQDLANEFYFLRKKGGHLLSKHRFLTAQMKGYLENDHWLDNARHANKMARIMAEGLSKKKVRLAYEVQANEVFPLLTETQDKALRAKGGIYYPWGSRDLTHNPKGDEKPFRLVMSFATTEKMISSFLDAIP